MRALVVAPLAGWLAGCAVMPTDAPVPNGEATIYVVGRGWHTDIGLSVDEVTGPLASLERDFPGIRFMVFGFGERQYYMAHDAGSGEMLTALLPSDSAILLTALRAPPAEAFVDQTVVTLHLSRSGVERIAMRLWDGLEKATGRFGGAACRRSLYRQRVLCLAGNLRRVPHLQHMDGIGVARWWTADQHARAVCRRSHGTGVADRGGAGVAGKVISKAAANHRGTPPWYPAARQQWCSKAVEDCCC